MTKRNHSTAAAPPDRWVIRGAYPRLLARTDPGAPSRPARAMQPADPEPSAPLGPFDAARPQRPEADSGVWVGMVRRW